MKKFNRVAPSPGSIVLEKGGKVPPEGTPLQSSSASLLEQKVLSPVKKERPDSAPQDRETRQPVPIDARVIIKGEEVAGKLTLSTEFGKVVHHLAPNAASTPLYSTVVKKTGAGTRGEASKNVYSDPVSLMPSLDAYEPEPLLETSVVIPNRGTAEPLKTSQVLENDYTTTPDPMYSTVEEVDASAASQGEMVDYDPALLKQLKKHDDKKGNVHLVSIKGTGGAITSSATMNFPQGSSTNMHALHYAASNGDKKLLAEHISALPVSQDTVEMVLGSEKLVKREGIDVADSEGRSPLMHAVHNNHLHAVKMLAENGANVNAMAAGEIRSLLGLVSHLV